MDKEINKVFKLFGKVQHYAWGGASFIPGLLHLKNPDQKPFAEYWMGAHVNASSEFLSGNGERVKLKEYIQAFPEITIGSKVYQQFGALPYLFKILDVKEMLSIQVHPSKKNAQEGYATENKMGIPLNAPYRNYKDDNHKPELMLALSEFWLLHGFKTPKELTSKLIEVPELNFLHNVFNQGGYYELYKSVMEMDQRMVNEVLQPLLGRILPSYEKNLLDKDDENFWAARAALTYNEPGKIDRGIFSIYLFNLVHVQKGDVIFQDAGLPHAYLEGQNVELMANSDNVLRGGLTPKHIDVQELLKHVRFEETIPLIIRALPLDEHVFYYPTPAPDFRLSRLELTKNDTLEVNSHSAEIYFVMKGAVKVDEKVNSFQCETGEAFVSFDMAQFRISSVENAQLYRASVPVG